MTAQVPILDPAKLEGYLRGRGWVDGPATIRALGGGISNQVWRIETGGKSFVLKQALPKLRVEQDWFCDPERIYEECAAIQALAGILPDGTVPRIIDEDRDSYCFVMSAAPAGARTWKDHLLEGGLRSGRRGTGRRDPGNARPDHDGGQLAVGRSVPTL